MIKQYLHLGTLTRNTLYNLAGTILPMIAAIVVLPCLLKVYGEERFGLLSYAWLFLGNFNLFDLGLSRSLTQIVAKQIGTEREMDDSIPVYIWTTLLLLFLIGLLLSILGTFFAKWLAETGLNISDVLRIEAKQVFYLFSVSIPVVVISGGFRGVLAAYRKFAAINVVRSIVGVSGFVIPLLIVLFTNSVPAAIAGLFLVRIVCCAVYAVLCFLQNPRLLKTISVRFVAMKEIFSVGAWITVSNIISPVMVYLDRFIIGLAISVAMVTYYATPHELVTKLIIIPGAFSGVLFPSFAVVFVSQVLEARRLLYNSIRITALIQFAIIFTCISFANEGLTLWINQKFAQNSTLVFQILLTGCFFNGVAQIPFSFLQGIGRPDIPAKLHLTEVIPLIVILWLLTNSFGIIGAAMAWSLRVIFDSIALLYFSFSQCKISARIKREIVFYLAVFCLFGIQICLSRISHRTIFFFSGMISFGFLFCFFRLSAGERAVFVRFFMDFLFPESKPS